MDKTIVFIKSCGAKKRAFGFYFGIVIAIFMLVTDIAYMFINGGAIKIDDYSRTLTFVMVLLGVFAELAVILVKNIYVSPLLPMVPAIFYSIGAGRQMYLTIYPVADLLTQVEWFGGSLSVYLSFFILFFIGTLASIVNCFFDNEKIDSDNNYLKSHNQ